MTLQGCVNEWRIAAFSCPRVTGATCVAGRESCLGCLGVLSIEAASCFEWLLSCWRYHWETHQNWCLCLVVFLKNIIHHTTGNHHWSPLEHARVEIKTSIRIAAELSDWERERGTSFLTITPHPVMCWYQKRRIIPHTDDIKPNIGYNIRGNFRTLLEYISEDGPRGYSNPGVRYFFQYTVSKALSEKYPAIFSPERTEELAKKFNASLVWSIVIGE